MELSVDFQRKWHKILLEHNSDELTDALDRFYEDLDRERDFYTQTTAIEEFERRYISNLTEEQKLIVLAEVATWDDLYDEEQLTDEELAENEPPEDYKGQLKQEDILYKYFYGK